VAIENVFARFSEEIPGYEAAVAAQLDGTVLAAHAGGSLDLPAQAGRLAAMASAYHEAYEGLGGIIEMGGNDEILVTTTKHYILIRPDHGRGVFLAIAIASSGNIGFLRLKMKRYLAEIVRG
jgi:predicted regulator of Ras-like GTPase activity (Roadblock/LC7/MglB family)